MANQLAGQTSPYLLQHADNPVDWYPWGAPALERAAREDKPLLVSIGYAACHWCHVMERESFEDEETAALMNEHFVAIKVDREERPDVDAIYMDAVQAMTGHGGWPLTAFCTPDGKPFFTGTYFPAEDRPGMPSFRKVLTSVAEAWRERREDLVEQGGRVIEAISRAAAPSGDPGVAPPEAGILDRALEVLRANFDPDWGGFGGPPKFPQPMALEFLLRMHLRGATDALPMLERTLDKMAAGGMYDQLGGGFARYSVDARWHVPHFEKMLYDNAQLARLYARAWVTTGEDAYRRVASETLDYLTREMQHAEGGFFSSQDADSEGVEGKFFTWTWDELVEIAGEPVAVALGASRRGNWEGTNVLCRPVPPDAVAGELGIGAEEMRRRLEAARADLFELRRDRVPPATDDKVLAGWNGLAIAAFAEAGRVLRDRRFVDEAIRAAEFVLSRLRDDRGRLLRSWREGVAGGPAFADDHALLADALLELYETTFDLRWFREARTLADELLRLFRDERDGGFYQAGSDADPLVLRPKEIEDTAVPSGNSVAADVLMRLAHLTGSEAYERAALSALTVVRDPAARWPAGFGRALSAMELAVSPVREVAIVGRVDDPATRALAGEVNVRRVVPNHVLAVAAPDDRAAFEEIELLRGRVQQDGRATAYVCERFTCRLPVAAPDELAEQLTA